MVFSTLLEMISSSEEYLFNCASLFIHDIALLPAMGTAAQRFTRQYIYSPKLIHHAETMLFSPNHFIRRQSVYLLAKLCSYNSVGEFQNAFNTYKETDPLLLPNLIFELQWLKAYNYWQLLDQTASSHLYLTRWAGMSTLRNNGDLDQRQFQVYLQSFAQDPHPLVRMQADAELTRLYRSN